MNRPLNYIELLDLTPHQLEEYFENNVKQRNDGDGYLLFLKIKKGFLFNRDKENLKKFFLESVEWVRKKSRLNCIVCLRKGKQTVALYRVGRTGFCKEHYAYGVRAQKKYLGEQKAFAMRHHHVAGRQISYSERRNTPYIVAQVQEIHASDFKVMEKRDFSNNMDTIRSTRSVRE